MHFKHFLLLIGFCFFFNCSYGADLEEETPEKLAQFSMLPRDLVVHITKFLDAKNFTRFGSTCRCLNAITKDPSVIISRVEIRFLNGKLIYRPNGDRNDDGKIEMRIADLSNPFDGTFDLSRCGSTGNYLSISTGYRKEKKAENASKVEIWLAPRFLIERNLAATAGHFQEIMGGWDGAAAPVGIFWNWGGWDNLGYYDYLTTNNMDEIGSENLFEKQITAVHAYEPFPSGILRTFSCSFCELK